MFALLAVAHRLSFIDADRSILRVGFRARVKRLWLDPAMA